MWEVGVVRVRERGDKLWRAQVELDAKVGALESEGLGGKGGDTVAWWWWWWWW